MAIITITYHSFIHRYLLGDYYEASTTCTTLSGGGGGEHRHEQNGKGPCFPENLTQNGTNSVLGARQGNAITEQGSKRGAANQT